MSLCSKLKNVLCKIVTKTQVVTKFTVTKSRLHCTCKVANKHVLFSFTPKEFHAYEGPFWEKNIFAIAARSTVGDILLM